MKRYIIDNSGISYLLEVAKNGRNRSIVRYWLSNKMDLKEICDITGYAESVIVSEIELINHTIETDLNNRVCKECGETFYTMGYRRVVCPECKEKQKKGNQDNAKGEKTSAKKPKPKPKKKPKTLMQIVREKNKYNKNNGTLLSYGQYVSMMGE